MVVTITVIGVALFGVGTIGLLWAFDDALRRLENRVEQAETDATTLTNKFTSLRQWYVTALWQRARQEVDDVFSQEGDEVDG